MGEILILKLLNYIYKYRHGAESFLLVKTAVCLTPRVSSLNFAR